MIILKAFERSPHLAEVKVSYRRGRRQDKRQTKMPWVVSTSRTAEEYVRSVWNKDTLELVEDFVIVCLNTSHEVLGWVKVATGGFSEATVDPRVVFAIALQTATAALVLAHNHPSGDTTPSPLDRAVTRRLKDAGKLLGIDVLDHIILTKDQAFSFADEGLL
jgi:DNA repair protein RadC